MDEVVAAFKAIINPKAFINKPCLEEVNELGRVIMSLEIKFREIDEWLLWRFDPNREDIFPFFAEGVRDLKSISDFFLLVKHKENKYLCIVELKSSSASAKKQLNASQVFAHFLINSAKRINLIEEEPQIVRVRIVKGKPTTTYRPPETENSCGYITYRWPVVFEVKKVLDVFRQENVK